MNITVNGWTMLLSELEQKLSPDGTRQLMAACIADLYDISVLNFGDVGIARPSPWPNLSPLYALERHGGDRTPRLILSGEMRDSFSVSVTPNSASLSNSSEYFELHQFGGFNENGDFIPARPMMPVTSDGNDLTEYAKAKLLEALELHFSQPF